MILIKAAFFYQNCKPYLNKQLQLVNFYETNNISIFIIVTLILHADTSKLGFKKTKINTIHPMSLDRVRCPACSSYTRIYAKNSNSALGDTSCRVDAADIHIDDTNLLSILCSGLMTPDTLMRDNLYQPLRCSYDRQ